MGRRGVGYLSSFRRTGGLLKRSLGKHCYMLPIKNDGGAWVLVLVLVYLCFGAGESFINHSSERGYSELGTN